MQFLQSDSIKITVSPEQEKQLSSKEKIAKNIKDQYVLAFDIYNEVNMIYHYK